MKLPVSVSNSTILAYKGPEIEHKRLIKAENFEWDSQHPQLLSILCITTLASNWTGYPKLNNFIYKDRQLFLQLLSIDSDLRVLVENIDDDFFWKRCYISKWGDLNITQCEFKWMNRFMQKYFSDFLENLNPSDYDPVKINELVKLCGPYIESLSIRSLIPSDIPTQRTVSPEMAHLVSIKYKNENIHRSSAQSLPRDHISLNAALGSLQNLKELHITFQLKNTGIDYRKDQFLFTDNDAKNLAKGLEKCLQLKVFRLTRSYMNCQRTKYVLKGMSDHHHLETLDFSHCKIGDDGALAIAKFLSRHENIKRLSVADNNIGPAGAESIANSLNHIGCGLTVLDLSLNIKLGSVGVAHIAVALARGCNLTSLNISGCGITPRPLMKPLAGVWSALGSDTSPTCGDLLARAIGIAKTPLRSLDISVNNIGPHSDAALANAVCLSLIVDVMLMRSGMSPMTIAIAESAAAAQKLRRDAEKGVMFKTRAGRVVQAHRVVRGMNIDADPILLVQQLSARPSIVSIASEDGKYNVATQPLPGDFGFVPALKSPLISSRSSSITGPPTSRRSSHHVILEPVSEVRRSALIRRGSDGLLLQPRSETVKKHIKIMISK